MKPQIQLAQRTSVKLQTTLVKYAAVASVIVAVVFISIFLINYLGTAKKAIADPASKGETAVTIGTSTTSVNLPINRYYDNSVCEMIYLQSEIAELGDITKLAFYKNSGSNSTTNTNVKIYLKHSTATQFANGNYSLSGYTLAYSGAFPNSSTGWNEVTLTTPFAYNNSDNLQVLIINQQAYTNNYPYYRYTSASNKARYKCWDGNSTQTYLRRCNYRNNIKITVSSASTPPPPPPPAPSGEVIVGTSTTSVNLPINRYYDNSVCEVIYLQNEIAQAGDITKLAFYKQSGNNNVTITNVKIYLKHSTATQFANGNYSLTGYTLAYSGAFPNSSTGWKEVTLDNAFTYNNSDNLQILIINEQAWTNGYPYYRYTSASNKARYKLWDGSSTQTYLSKSSYRNNIKMTISTSTPVDPSIITNPTAGQLYISEYAAAGHLGVNNNEFIELYNNTDSTIDLSNCTMKLYKKAVNGNGNQEGSALQLTGTLLADSFYVIAVRNKSNKQPTSALSYDIQAPATGNGWEIKDKTYLELLCGSTVIDNAGSLSGHGGDNNYERTDVLVDGTNMTTQWKIVSNSLSSPGAENISDDVPTQAVSSSSYTNFGGNGNGSAAVKIKSNGSNSPGNTKVKVVRGKEHPNKPAGTTMLKRYVEITPTNQPDNVEMVYYYNDSELNGLTETNLKLYSYYDGTWHLQGGVVDPVNNTITVTMINHFSDWGAGEGGGGLPIDLLSFDAKFNGKSVDLIWTTATETNNDYFTIERSMDAKNYQVVDNVKGAGNSNSILSYSYNDREPFTGTIYYRLKQTDYDGKNETFPPVAVSNSTVQSQLPLGINSVSPNPFTNSFFLEFDSQSQEVVEINIYNVRGQIICKDTYRPSEGINRYTYTDQNDLSPGYYVLTLKQGSKRSKGYKIIKK